MKPLKNFTEFTYLKELADKISNEFPQEQVESEKRYGRLIPDLSVKSGDKTILIEVKYTRNYRSLPFSTLTQLEDYKRNIPNSELILISFSNINELMREKLKELDIITLVNPDIDTVINEIKKIKTAANKG